MVTWMAVIVHGVLTVLMCRAFYWLGRRDEAREIAKMMRDRNA